MPHVTFIKGEHIFKMKEYMAEYLLAQYKWISKLR